MQQGTNCLFIKEAKTCYKLCMHLKLTYITNVPVLYDFPLTVKAATLIFISGRGSAISSAEEGKSGFIYNLVKR